jgi:hypothetical protein
MSSHSQRPIPNIDSRLLLFDLPSTKSAWKLATTCETLAHGKTIKIKGFPKHHKVKLFRVEVSTHRTDWVVTNDIARDSSVLSR